MLHTDTFLKRKCVHICSIICWNFHSFMHSFTEQRLAEFLPCATCLGMPGDINTNMAPQGLLVCKIAHKAVQKLALYFSFSPASPFAVSPQRTPSTTPILYPSHLNKPVALCFSKPHLFCLQHSLLGLPWLFFFLCSNHLYF